MKKSLAIVLFLSASVNAYAADSGALLGGALGGAAGAAVGYNLGGRMARFWAPPSAERRVLQLAANRIRKLLL